MIAARYHLELAMEETEHPVPQAWITLVAAAKAWARHLDQWDKFKFQTESGPVYVSIRREDQYPDSFEDVSDV